ncbi:hypothetical protein BDFG_01795 [Blastomyces dermatitidis ATCC 26199]|nr:hypothetical protein BDFG_01795 [Blastomyces dermatitidis ATCC 26199]
MTSNIGERRRGDDGGMGGMKRSGAWKERRRGDEKETRRRLIENWGRGGGRWRWVTDEPLQAFAPADNQSNNQTILGLITTGGPPAIGQSNGPNGG